MPSVLEQLGMNVSPIEMPPAGMPGAPPTGAPPVGVTEAETAPVMEGAMKLADTIVAGAIKGLEMAVSIYGVGSEKGKVLVRVLNSLEKVVPEDKVDELLKGAVPAVGAAPMAPTPSAPPAGAPAASPGGADILNQLLKGGK